MALILMVVARRDKYLRDNHLGEYTSTLTMLTAEYTVYYAAHAMRFFTQRIGFLSFFICG